MKYKNKLLFNMWLGITLVFIACLIAERAGFLELLSVKIYVPVGPFFTFILVSVLFVAGLGTVINSIGELLFRNFGEPNYVYNKKGGYILVRFTSTKFKIKRDGVELWVRMTLDLPYFSRKLSVNEVGTYNYMSDKYITGKPGSDTQTTSNGQKLYFKRYLTGIMISWDKSENPWKVVVD